MNLINREEFKDWLAANVSLDWCRALLSSEELLASIQAFDKRTERRYSEEGQLDHYQRLGAKLWQRFRDPELTLAGYLHGVTGTHLLRLDARIPPQVLEILKNWERLVQLRPDKPGFRAEHQEATLKEMERSRSALLFVYERLDRYDPDGSLAGWCARFRARPEPFESPTISKASKDRIRKSERYSESDPEEFLAKAVAPAAVYWGLWQESTILRDAAFLYSKPDRFHEVVDFATKWHARGQSSAERLENRLGRWLPALSRKLDVRWEWRHAASIGSALEGLPPDQWQERFYDLGFVTVVCPGEASCYQLLGHLHRRFYFRREFFRDAIGDPTRSGYRALHTALKLEGRQDEVPFVAVRLIPRRVDEGRVRQIDRGLLGGFRSQLESWRTQLIPVASPRRELRFLPLGSTILDFVAVEKPSKICEVRGATLNSSQEVGLFHLLQPGDIIALREGPMEPLPACWKNKVAPVSVERIERAVENSLSELLEHEGRGWLKRDLEDLKIEDRLLDLLAESVVADVDDQKQGLRWWLRQLGALGSKSLPEMAGIERVLSEDKAEALRRQFTSRVQGLQLYLPVPKIDRQEQAIREIRRCTLCLPSRISALAYTLVDEVVTIHREDERCAVNAVPFLRQHLTHGQVFHVEASGGPGVAQSILNVFAERGVSLVEVAIRALAWRWGVGRIETEPLAPVRVLEIVKDLEKLPSVIQVHGPDTKPPPIVTQTLPTRIEETQYFLDQPPQPFNPGVVSSTPHYFYGRNPEFSKLVDILQQVRRGDGGEAVFVHGSLKTGKTSLVQQFQSLLSRDHRRLTFIAYEKSAVGQRWSAVKKRLFAKLKAHVEKTKHIWGLQEHPVRGTTLERYLASIQGLPRLPAVVLAVDEAVRLFETCQRGGAIEELEAFCSKIEQIPGVLLIWIGPEAPVRRLDRRLREILVQGSFPLRVGPLDREAVGEMLRASKLSGFHSIQISEDVVAQVFELTGGDPFWTALLGDSLWGLARAIPGKSVAFDRDLVEEALDRMILTSTPFEGRFFPRGTEDAEESQKLALLLAVHRCTQTLRGQSAPGICSLENLLALAQRRDLELNPKQASVLLDDLRACGALRSEGGRWRLAAPIVGRYLETHWRMELDSTMNREDTRR